MEMKLYDTWILNDMEINLCARILGYADWYQIEIEDNGESIEAAMLEGFIRLVEMGLLHGNSDYFRPTVQMCTYILPVIAPERIIRVSYDGGNDVYFQKEGKILVKMEQLQTERRSFRLLFMSEEDITEFLEIPEKTHYSEMVILVLDGEQNQQKAFRIFESDGCIWLSEEGEEQKELYSEETFLNRLFSLEEKDDID